MEPLSPAKTFGFLIRDTARLLSRKLDQRAQSIGMTSAQWRVLANIAICEARNQEPMNQAALADLLDMEPISLSRQIDRIEAAGLIERRPDPSDRRAHRLFLTEAARPLVTSFRALGAEVLSEAFAGIDEAEMATAIAVLTRIRDNISGKPDNNKTGNDLPLEKTGNDR